MNKIELPDDTIQLSGKETYYSEVTFMKNTLTSEDIYHMYGKAEDLMRFFMQAGTLVYIGISENQEDTFTIVIKWKHDTYLRDAKAVEIVNTILGSVSLQGV
jgi:hypothetical protein